eukprot:Skav218542  [mRNA]  locus=scaffold3191:82155:87110:+ [translate_table: standard]
MSGVRQRRTQVPYYLGLILGDAVVAFRVLRLMRVVRLLKPGDPGQIQGGRCPWGCSSGWVMADVMEHTDVNRSMKAVQKLQIHCLGRLGRLAKHHPGIQLCVEAMVESGLPLAILMFFNIIFGIIFASAMFYFEGSEYSVDPQFTNSSFPTGVFVRKDTDGQDILTPFRSIPVALWWVFTTTTTVGYGDMAPTSHLGRALGVLCFYIGAMLLAGWING